jgi:hypothetical protein
VGDNYDPAKQTYTASGKQHLRAAGAAWDKYMALNPKKPDEGLARQMIQAYLSLNQPAKATSAQEIVAQVDPTQQTFTNLAILAYQANQTRKGDLAAAKAVSLAPKKERKQLKQQLASAKSQSQIQQIQQSQPTPTPTIG